MKKYIKKDEKGITLVALGIMIIILLILAGVETANMDDMNGIVSKAEETKDFAESQNAIDLSEENDLNSEAISRILE